MTHTYRQFDADFARLRSASTTMAGLVERQIRRAVDAVLNRDLDLVAQVLADETEVNRMHMHTDLMCNRMIAKMQPIAVDLRELLATLHMNNDLERVGDEAKKIARKARGMEGLAMPIDTLRIARMADLACEMLRRAVDAYVRQDAEAAAALEERDDEVDDLRDQLTADLTATMIASPQNVSAALALIFVVQSLERVGDHATNISEYVVTVVEGRGARHDRVAAAVKRAR